MDRKREHMNVIVERKIIKVVLDKWIRDYEKMNFSEKMRPRKQKTRVEKTM